MTHAALDPTTFPCAKVILLTDYTQAWAHTLSFTVLSYFSFPFPLLSPLFYWHLDGTCNPAGSVENEILPQVVSTEMGLFHS